MKLNSINSTKNWWFDELFLDCSVEDENDEICMYDFTNGHLQDKFSSDIKWVTFLQTRANAELVSLAMALNSQKKLFSSGLRIQRKLQLLIQQLRTH
jgi:hypothetical protein